MYARFDGVIVLTVATLGLFGALDPAGSAGAVTQRVYGGSFDLSIPADPDASMGWMTDAVIDVPDHLIIRDLDAGLTLTHTSAFDLQLFLTSPAGTTVILNCYDSLDEYFEGANYEQTIFDDEALMSIEDASAPYTGRFRPVDPLAAFDGQDAYGPWRLRIYDAFYADTGHLDAFDLAVTTVPEPSTIALSLFGLGALGFPAYRRVSRRSSLRVSG